MNSTGEEPFSASALASADEALLESAVEQLRTVADCVRFGASLFNRHEVFFGHGTDNATDEACTLVLHALSLDFGLAPELWSARLLTAERREVLGLLLRRVRERRPAAYLTGRAWFAGLAFEVDEHVLIPRSPIAELIGAGFQPWLGEAYPARILDLCTGSGCIGIACAHAFPDSEVDLADISTQALAVAERNVARFALEDRVRPVRSDLLDDVDGPYDLVVCNPPYVPEAEMSTLPEEYRHEPELGLAAGPAGLDCIERLLLSAPDIMAEDGWLVLEVGSARGFFEEAYFDLPVEWPQFERGGSDVALIHRPGLTEWRDSLRAQRDASPLG